MKASWSYKAWQDSQEQNTVTLPESWETAIERECRCDSHHLFCWGHEKYCSYNKDNK